MFSGGSRPWAKGGGRGNRFFFCRFPCRLFFLLRFFLTKIKMGADPQGPSSRSAIAVLQSTRRRGLQILGRNSNHTKVKHQTKPSAAAKLKRKFSTTGVSFRCFNASKVILALPPSSNSTASFFRLFMRSFVLTDNSWKVIEEHF